MNCRSFKDIRTIGKDEYPTYRDACYLGLLDDDKEYIDAIIEASLWASEQELRMLFATLLSSDCISLPEEVWNKCWKLLSDDIQFKKRVLLKKSDLILSEDDIKNSSLIEIDRIIQKRGKRLNDYPGLPHLDYMRAFDCQESFIGDEMQYDRLAELYEFNKLHPLLNDEHISIFDTVVYAIDKSMGGFFFIYGYGGTRKTFIWRTLSAYIRSKGEIVLNVASSGIASLLLPVGRTAHSRFKISISINEDSTCNIRISSPLARLIMMCKLIIWDEAPMMHKYCFECLDRTLNDIMKTTDSPNSDQPFGGKIVVLGGDFRQILLVIPKGKRPQIVNATVNSSYLWNYCKVMKLTKNMRLQSCSSEDDKNELKNFSEWIASIGDGTIGPPNDGEVEIKISSDLVKHGGKKPIDAIVSAIYLDYNGSLIDFSYLHGRAILTPTLDLVDEINDHMVEINKSKLSEYLSSDSSCRSDSGTDSLKDLNTPEFLNSIKYSGVPNHKLNLKEGTPVMLLRNIDHSLGLCNGTRMVITRLCPHVLEAQLISGANVGQTILLPRMTLTPSDTNIPFRFRRRQFPLIVSYAMIINKSQGQSLSSVGVFLKQLIFSHGQLYVVVSRVTNRKGLKLLMCDRNGQSSCVTKNVVYKEIFQNL